MYEHLVEINRIKNMDEKQILLKARNVQKFPFMSDEQYEQIRKAVNDKLNIYGYELRDACCGRKAIVKLNEK